MILDGLDRIIPRLLKPDPAIDRVSSDGYNPTIWAYIEPLSLVSALSLEEILSIEAEGDQRVLEDVACALLVGSLDPNEHICRGVKFINQN